MVMLSRLFVITMCVAALTGCSSPPSSENTRPAAGAPPASSPAAAAGERKYLLERVGDAAVVQLYADGFSSLPLREKTLIYHLSQAAIAGRDIFYDQKHRHALEMRRILEAIVSHPQGIDGAALGAIQ